MIHEIGVELGAQISAKGCPFPVVDGPEYRPTTTFARERIVIEHNPSSGDAFTQPGEGARHQADLNPRTLMSRVIGVKITIYAKSPTRAAIYWEHKRRAEQVLDMVLCGLYKVVKIRKNLLSVKSGKFVLPDDLKESETPGGAVYELLITVDRGVADRNWDGTAGPTVTVPTGMIKSKTQASDEEGGETETACGA